MPVSDPLFSSWYLFGSILSHSYGSIAHFFGVDLNLLISSVYFSKPSFSLPLNISVGLPCSVSKVSPTRHSLLLKPAYPLMLLFSEAAYSSSQPPGAEVLGPFSTSPSHTCKSPTMPCWFYPTSSLRCVLSTLSWLRSWPLSRGSSALFDDLGKIIQSIWMHFLVS